MSGIDEIVIRVEAQELIRLRGILLDGDHAEALRFLRDHCQDEIKRLDSPHCAPTFDQTYHPGRRQPKRSGQ